MKKITVRTNFTYKANAKRRIAQALAVGVGQAAAALAAEQKRGLGRGARFRASAPGSAPNVQRGQLRNAIQSANDTANPLKAYAGVMGPKRLGYALLHETGQPNVIRPKNAKYLKVPVNDAARRADERGGAGPVATFIKRRGKPPILIGDGKVRYKDAGSGLRINAFPVWVLKDYVLTVKRPYLLPAVARAKPEMTRRFQQAAAAFIRKGVA